MRTPALVLACVLTMGPSPVGASHPHEDLDPCAGTVGGAYVSHQLGIRVPTVGAIGVIPLVDPARGPFYLDVRDAVSEYNVVWIKMYQETNGIAGLQRWRGSHPWGEIPVLYPGTDDCREGSSQDSLVF